MPRPTLKVYKKRKPVFSGKQRHSLNKETSASQVEVSEPSASESRPSTSESETKLTEPVVFKLDFPKVVFFFTKGTLSPERYKIFQFCFFYFVPYKHIYNMSIGNA